MLMRKADANPKAKEKILDCAQELMLSQGYGATTIENICKAAELTKGSFFHYFKSKEDLCKAVVERFCCASFKGMEENCCQSKEKDPLKRVFHYLDFMIKLSKQPMASKGCLLGTLAQELSDTYPQIRKLCEEGFNEWTKRLKKDLSEAKSRYVPQAAFSPESVAEHFIN